MPRILEERFALLGDPAQEGAHCVLHRASDLERDGAQVAVKLFRPSRALDDRILQAAWTSELAAYQAFGTQPNLVRLLDWGRATEDGAPFLVFEWLQCDLLEQLNRVDIEGWDDFWPIARDVLEGLAVIHRAGYVHRDLKPENVLVAEDGALKVADFGTARLVETINMGLTLGPLGTIPYAPPERGTLTPAPSYDVYSFVVLTCVCMSQKRFTSHEEVVAAFGELDLPPDVADILRSGLALDPADRPDSASTLLAELSEAQGARERRREPDVDVFVSLHPPALAALEKQLGLPNGTGAAYLRDDLAAVGALAFDHRVDPSQSPDLEIAGQTLVCRCQPHRSQPGVLMVLRATRPPAQVLEYARTSWWRPHVRFRFTHPTDPARASADLQTLLKQVSDHSAQRAAEEAANEAAQAFSSWRRLLRAKFALENERGADIRYQGFEVLGSRVRFRVDTLPQLEPGEGRLVRSGRRRVLFGEVEGAENDGLILYVTGGTVADLPKSGVLEFDSEASKSKLRREQAALDRITEGRAVRPELRELLLNPSSAAVTAPLKIDRYWQPDLDDAKRAAVSRSLGARDFTLVQGPPGTGKTTFIAELVAQFLERSPGGRVVLTSQTHIALDNALVKISELCANAVLLRLGPAERLTPEVESLAVPAQMERWREAVLTDGREFLRQFAASLGITVSDVDIKTLSVDLIRRRDQLHELRSRIALRRAERKRVVEDLDRLNRLAPEVLAAAQAVDDAGRSSAASELVAAAERFVESGLRLATQLESAAPLSERLVDLESSLSTWQSELREQAEAESQLRSKLGDALGKPDATAEELLASAEANTPADPRLAKLEAIGADWEERFGKGVEFNAALILRSDVVAATCVGLTGVPGVDQIPFDLCIIDEASKATTTETLVPLVLSRQWVLVGDDRQLPPFVEHALEQRELLDRFELTPNEVRETLFSILAERLPDGCKVALTQQHRMHPVIGRLISECFYDGKLKSIDRDVSPAVAVALQQPVVWLDTSGRGDRRERAAGRSTKNRGEARVISKLLDRLNWVCAQKDVQLSVAVLTGYDAQRKEIVDALSPGEIDRNHVSARIATVDAYQGQEADVCIFSVTRSNEDRELGFLRSEERVNVALSRARDGLVIVGDVSFIESVTQGANPLARVLQHIRAATSAAIEVAT